MIELKVVPTIGGGGGPQLGPRDIRFNKSTISFGLGFRDELKSEYSSDNFWGAFARDAEGMLYFSATPFQRPNSTKFSSSNSSFGLGINTEMRKRRGINMPVQCKLRSPVEVDGITWYNVMEINAARSLKEKLSDAKARY